MVRGTVTIRLLTQVCIELAKNAKGIQARK